MPGAELQHGVALDNIGEGLERWPCIRTRGDGQDFSAGVSKPDALEANHERYVGNAGGSGIRTDWWLVGAEW
jgi:hypothetical protein